MMIRRNTMKYDELDLMELFLSDSESLTDNYGDGNLLYKIKKENFELKIFIRTYEYQISVFLKYNEKDIFYGDFSKITELKKDGMYLIILREEREIAKLCFGDIFSVDIEE